MGNIESGLYQTLELDKKQEAIIKSLEFVPGERISRDCQECGACCVAYSVENLKDSGEKCPHLEIKDGKFFCDSYDNRPQTCKAYDCRAEKIGTRAQRLRVRELSSAFVILQEVRKQSS